MMTIPNSQTTQYPGLKLSLLGLSLSFLLMGIGGIWFFVGVFSGQIIPPLICILVGSISGISLGVMAVREWFIARRKRLQSVITSSSPTPNIAGLIIGVFVIFKSFMMLLAILLTIAMPFLMQTLLNKQPAPRLTSRSTRTQPWVAAIML